MLAFIKGEIDR